MKNIKILGLGSPILDLLVNIDDSFIDSIDGDKGGMALVSSDEISSLVKKSGQEPQIVPGGSAANTIFGLSELGAQTAILGCVGNDENGKFYTDAYKEIGGDADLFKVTKSDASTAQCLSLITPDSERTMRTDLGAATDMGVDDITAESLKGISHIHIEGYALFAPGLVPHILELAKCANITTSLDLASFEVVNAMKDSLKTLLNDVTIVFANEDEANAFCGDDKSVEEQAGILSEYCSTVVIKLGKKGSFIKNGDEEVAICANTVQAVDTTGAGDLWQAGFLFGFLNGKSIQEAGDFGSILGAAVVEIIGAKISDTKWKEIKQTVKI